MEYEKMKSSELLAEIQKLNDQREDLRQEAKKITAILDRKLALESAEKKVSAMSDIEKEALAQVIASKGIKSAEKFGKMKI